MLSWDGVCWNWFDFFFFNYHWCTWRRGFVGNSDLSKHSRSAMPKAIVASRPSSDSPPFTERICNINYPLEAPSVRSTNPTLIDSLSLLSYCRYYCSPSVRPYVLRCKEPRTDKPRPLKKNWLNLKDITAKKKKKKIFVSALWSLKNETHNDPYFYFENWIETAMMKSYAIGAQLCTKCLLNNNNVRKEFKTARMMNGLPMRNAWATRTRTSFQSSWATDSDAMMKTQPRTKKCNLQIEV